MNKKRCFFMANNSKQVMQAADQKRAATRSRNWWFVIYPEDLPENYMSIIEGFRVSELVSMMHDIDPKEDENGNPLKNEIGEPIYKKKHKHVLMMFTTNKTFDFVVKLWRDAFGTTETGAIKGVATPRLHECRVADKHTAARYLAHLDQPEKAQYDASEIVGMNGADVLELLKGGMTQELEMFRTVHRYIIENDVTEYWVLCHAFVDDSQLYNHIIHHTVHYEALTRSLRFSLQGDSGK